MQIIVISEHEHTEAKIAISGNHYVGNFLLSPCHRLVLLLTICPMNSSYYTTQLNLCRFGGFDMALIFNDYYCGASKIVNVNLIPSHLLRDLNNFTNFDSYIYLISIRVLLHLSVVGCRIPHQVFAMV